jgi:hypothetical protein
MHIILRKLPFFDRSTTAIVQGRLIPIKPDQIIVWVGLMEGGAIDFDRGRPFFPAILDTGHSHNFSIREEHLIQWGGLHPQHLSRYGEVRIGGDQIPLLQADLWLPRNEQGVRDRQADREPFCLELDSGIAVYPRAMSLAPRLPLLGLRALRWANLHLTIDCRRRLVTLRTAPRFWCF